MPEEDPWLVPPQARPACPLSNEPCTHWSCLTEVCSDEGLPDPYGTPRSQRIRAEVDRNLVRSILEAVCRRDGLPLDSRVADDEPARNYELALRLGIGHVFGLTDDPNLVGPQMDGVYRWLLAEARWAASIRRDRPFLLKNMSWEEGISGRPRRDLGL